MFVNYQIWCILVAWLALGRILLIACPSPSPGDGITILDIVGMGISLAGLTTILFAVGNYCYYYPNSFTENLVDYLVAQILVGLAFPFPRSSPFSQ